MSASKTTTTTDQRSAARADRLDTSRNTSRNSQDGLRAALRIDERVGALRDRLESRADSRSAAALRNDVRDARSHVRGWDKTNVSSTTAARYERVVRQMKVDGARPEDVKCRASFEFRQAALVHHARVSIKEGLRDLDKARRTGDLRGAATAYNALRFGLDTLRRYPPSSGSREQDLTRRSAYRGPSRAAPDRSNGKRPSLNGLPHDWRDRVQAEVRESDRAAVAVMSLTGARPAELKGVKIRQSGDQITLTIRGAKVDEDRGLPQRTLEFSREELEQSQAGRDLSDWLGARTCRTVAHEGSLSSFRERVSRAADRAGLPAVSSYTYRHAEARELKLSGTDREEISRRLGHRSERSQSVYG